MQPQRRSISQKGNVIQAYIPHVMESLNKARDPYLYAVPEAYFSGEWYGEHLHGFSLHRVITERLSKFTQYSAIVIYHGV